MRFGLVGTGFWAGYAHAAGLKAAEGAELVGVWGRDPAKAQALAGDVGCRAFPAFDDLLAEVDAVSFSVPPDVQAAVALQAAEAGKHLLLEKPVALSVEAATAVEQAVAAAGVASVVFFTNSYTPERRAWLAQLKEAGPWRGATALWLGAAFAEGSPFDTPWRREKGALWDIGPHFLSALLDAVGPVEQVLSAVRGEGDVVHLALLHTGGATSTVTATLDAAPAVSRSRLEVWGDSAVSEMPRSAQSVPETFAVAAQELMAAAVSGVPHSHDVGYGRRVVEILAEAQRLLDVTSAAARRS